MPEPHVETQARARSLVSPSEPDLGSLEVPFVLTVEIELEFHGERVRPALAPRTTLGLIDLELHTALSDLAQRYSMIRSSWGRHLSGALPRQDFRWWGRDLDHPPDVTQLLGAPVFQSRGHDLDFIELGRTYDWQGIVGFFQDSSRGGKGLQVRLDVVSVTFQEGSFLGILKGIVRKYGSTGGVLLVTVLNGPVVETWYDDYKMNRSIERIVEGQSCTTISSWEFKVGDLRRVVAEQLKFEAPGISPDEKYIRICNLQLALRLIQGSPELIDGLYGPRTDRALGAFAEAWGLEKDIRSDELRGRLIVELSERIGQ